MSNYLPYMGWNEILARVFEPFTVQHDASPDWLVNPATRRKLKLDQLYPEIGIAVRLVGFEAKGRGRKSDWEALEEESRDETRKALCRLHGVELFLLAPDYPFPAEQLNELAMLLGAASRRLAKQRSNGNKGELMERLSKARKQLDAIRRQVNKAEDLAAFAELWRDRETAAVAVTQAPAPASNGKARRKVNFQPGQYVRHTHFGTGVVTAVEAQDGDTVFTVNFVTAGERRLMASLVGDKLAPDDRR